MAEVCAMPTAFLAGEICSATRLVENVFKEALDDYIDAEWGLAIYELGGSEECDADALSCEESLADESDSDMSLLEADLGSDLSVYFKEHARVPRHARFARTSGCLEASEHRPEFEAAVDEMRREAQMKRVMQGRSWAASFNFGRLGRRPQHERFAEAPVKLQETVWALREKSLARRACAVRTWTQEFNFTNRSSKRPQHARFAERPLVAEAARQLRWDAAAARCAGALASLRQMADSEEASGLEGLVTELMLRQNIPLPSEELPLNEYMSWSCSVSFATHTKRPLFSRFAAAVDIHAVTQQRRSSAQRKALRSRSWSAAFTFTRRTRQEPKFARFALHSTSIQDRTQEMRQAAIAKRGAKIRSWTQSFVFKQRTPARPRFERFANSGRPIAEAVRQMRRAALATRAQRALASLRCSLEAAGELDSQEAQQFETFFAGVLRQKEAMDSAEIDGFLKEEADRAADIDLEVEKLVEEELQLDKVEKLVAPAAASEPLRSLRPAVPQLALGAKSQEITQWLAGSPASALRRSRSTFRLDEGEARTVQRDSSLARGYAALGAVEIHRMDADDDAPSNAQSAMAMDLDFPQAKTKKSARKKDRGDRSKSCGTLKVSFTASARGQPQVLGAIKGTHLRPIAFSSKASGLGGLGSQSFGSSLPKSMSFGNELVWSKGPARKRHASVGAVF